jgi:peptidoglycan hydrolase CwlO-like protein
MYKMVLNVTALLLFGLSQTGVAAASTAEANRDTGGNKGITVDDLGRGLKSAANNVEKEIPKMGSAIGNVFKKITDKGAEKTSSQESAKQKK